MSEFSSKDYANGYRDGTQSAEATLTALRAENEKLRAALAFYANGENWSNPFGISSILNDGGKHARAALSSAVTEGT